MTLHERLKEARARAGMSQAQAANALSLTPQQIWNMENRDDDVSSVRLFLVADTYQVNARWLATGESKPEEISSCSPRVIQISKAISVLPPDRQQALAVLLGVKFERD